MRRQFEDPYLNDGAFEADPFGFGPFSHARSRTNRAGSLFDGVRSRHAGFGLMDNMFPSLPSLDDTQHATFHTSSRGVFTRGPDGNGQWVTQSTTMRSINGVTETVTKRTDSSVSH